MLLVSLIIWSFIVLKLFAKNVTFYQVKYIVHVTYLIFVGNIWNLQREVMAVHDSK